MAIATVHQYTTEPLHTHARIRIPDAFDHVRLASALARECAMLSCVKWRSVVVESYNHGDTYMHFDTLAMDAEGFARCAMEVGAIAEGILAVEADRKRSRGQGA